MAFGFTPSFTGEVYTENLTHPQFLALAVETAKNIGWELSFLSESGFMAYTASGMFKWKAKVTLTMEGDSAVVKSESTGNEMMDLGKNKKTVQRFMEAFSEAKGLVTASALDEKYEGMKADFAPADQDILNPVRASGMDKSDSFLSFFVPRQGFFITPILVDLNILIFALMVINGASILLPSNEILIRWGANFRPLTLEGEWWRLLANCFLHIGVIHLLMNMFALVYIGLLLEPFLGRVRFTAAYLLTGITASITSLWWHNLTISAGASGAIFGLYGVFLALLTTNYIEKKARKALLTSIGIFVAYNLLYGMKGGIDNAAHVGGLIGGLVIGYAYIPGMNKPGQPRRNYLDSALLTLVVLTVTFMIYRKIPDDIGQYNRKMQQFITGEQRTLEFFKLPSGTPKNKLLSEIQDTAIYYWNQNKKLLSEMEQLNIPDGFRQRDRTLLDYCDLRLRIFTLIYRSIDENTDRYSDSIRQYNDRLENILDSLSGK